MMIKKTIITSVAVLLLCGFVSGNDILTFSSKETIHDSLNAGKKACFYSARAKQKFISIERDKPFGLPKAALAADYVDTITIIAFRISFVREDIDDPNTTGDGAFDTRDSATFVNDEGHWLDPSPHNRHYFEAHLRSLSHYWSVVSGGRLHIEYEVWPQGPDQDINSYQLAQPMAYYGEGRPENGLAAFFHEALTKAYNTDGSSIDFTDVRGNKKAVILFHAGADRQTDLSFSETPTPSDLFTAFVTFDGESILVLGNDSIPEGIIMPETMSQDNRVTVMNAVMAHEFGHQLGLVDLYNTGSSPFLSQFGDFALMDNNGLNTAAYIDIFGTGAFGTVPIFPSAWSRAFLGFNEVVEYREGTSIELAAVKMESDDIKIAKIPISATEYYLIENRRADLDGELQALRVDSTSNVVLWPVKLVDVIDGDSVITLKIPVPEYDVYLPENASGLAIWHIDEAVAAMDYYPYDIGSNNFEANKMQWDPNRRFIRLIEADGIIDFGGNYSRGYGQAADLFFEGNNNLFASYTNPATLSNSGGYTHINIANISEPGMTMTFDLVREKTADNFPRRVSIPNRTDLAPIAADIDGDGNDEILITSGNKVFAISANGLDYLDPLDSLDDFDMVPAPIDVNTNANILRPRDTSLYKMPVFGEILSGEISTVPVVSKFLDTTQVLIGTDNGLIYSYLPYSTSIVSPQKYRARITGLRRLLDGGEVSMIIPDSSNNIVYAMFSNGGVLAFPYDSGGIFTNPTYGFGQSFSGACRYKDGIALLYQRVGFMQLYMVRFGAYPELDDSLVFDSITISDSDYHPPIATDLNRDSIDEIIMLSRNGRIVAFSFSPDGIVDYSEMNVQTGDTALAGPIAADINGNGYPEVFAPGTNRIYGYSGTGIALDDFPVEIDYGRPGQLVITKPIISDVNGDGVPDLSVITLDSIPRGRDLPAIFTIYPDTINYPDSSYKLDTVLTYAYYNYFSNLYAVTPGAGILSEFPVPVGIFGMRGLEDTIVGAATPLHVKTGTDGIMAICGADGWLDAWQCGWSDNGALWTMDRRTADNGAYLPLDELGEETALSEFLPESRFYNYPNPAIGNNTTIRFYLNQPAQVTISIYDAQGDKVTEMSRNILDGNRNEEVIWELSDVASGIYHCRLEAVSSDNGETKVAFTTIAVVK